MNHGDGVDGSFPQGWYIQNEPLTPSPRDQFYLLKENESFWTIRN